MYLFLCSPVEVEEEKALEDILSNKASILLKNISTKWVADYTKEYE
uniref:Uncharacterized protein n=1 Tax=Rhizophora mucronata TaxID=61149 RepID=A0A2P2PXI7_RHIMU